MLILDILFRLPSTFLHELAHFIIALLTFSDVKGFSLIPRIENKRIVLGRVSVSPRYKVALTFVGFAPLLNAVIAFAIYYYDVIVVNRIFTFILQFYLLLGSIPSWQDIKVAIEGLFSISGIILIFSILIILKIFIT